MLSKTSKGRYLDLKRASLASQKGVNCKPIYALFVCSFRFFFYKTRRSYKGYRDFKRQKYAKLKCSSVTLSFFSPANKQLVNSSTRYLVYQIIVLLLLCLLITLSTSNSLTCLLVNSSTKQTLPYLLFFLWELGR